MGLALCLVTGCFIKPDRPRNVDDGGTEIDARVCPVISDDFEDPSGPPCGAWGGRQGTGTLERTGGRLQTTVGTSQSAGCLSATVALSRGLWLEIDTSQAPNDDTSFSLFVDGRQITLDIRPSPPTATIQGRTGTPSIIVDPATTQIYFPDQMKFWRFSRGMDTSLYRGIDLSYSPDGQPDTYIKLLRFGVSGPEPMTATAHFEVTGANTSTPHLSTAFDNFNRPCE